MDGGGGGGDGGGSGGVLSLEEANFFQVASLDERGTVSIWLASEAPRGDDGGSQVGEQKPPNNFVPPFFGMRCCLCAVGRPHSRAASKAAPEAPSKALTYAACNCGNPPIRRTNFSHRVSIGDIPSLQ